MNPAQYALVGKICRTYEEYYNTSPYAAKKKALLEDLTILCHHWNTQIGIKCDHCGTILQIMITGTMINCEWSRKMLQLPPISCP